MDDEAGLISEFPDDFDGHGGSVANAVAFVGTVGEDSRRCLNAAMSNVHRSVADEMDQMPFFALRCLLDCRQGGRRNELTCKHSAYFSELCMRQDEFRDQLKAFEKQLDAALSTLPIFDYDADGALALCANIDEMIAAERKNPGGGPFSKALIILAPYLVSGTEGVEPDIENLAECLIFAGHYYSIRESLYYSYNVPGSLAWKFEDDRVEIRFSDPTIPRQFFTVFNDVILLSIERFHILTNRKKIRDLLRGEVEGVLTEKTEMAFGLIEEEVDVKLDAYFSIIPRNAEIDLGGGYTYRQFLELYRGLLTKALYHRYLTELNGVVGAVFIDEDELIDAALHESQMPAAVVRAILADIVFDERALQSRADASYFSLHREGRSRRIVMRPHDFAVAEGLVSLLRVIAQRRPQAFLDRVSNVIGSGFVQRAKEAWEAQGFIAHSEVSLRAYDPTLPDIDLLVISEEPTLGYVIFVCEVKGPIPPRWAKDQLKVLNKDNVSKAFVQSEKIQEFLYTSDGVNFLRNLLPEKGIDYFDGFVIAVNSLIITSDNAGMFFGEQGTKIINFRTLERLLRKSDGDIAYIQHMLAHYNEHADKVLETENFEFRVGRRTVSYEGVVARGILDFPQTQWRTSLDREVMIQDFIASGAHPFDVLPFDPRLDPGEDTEDG